eukprot:1002663-Ditylum_brightwellii.AAC.1
MCKKLRSIHGFDTISKEEDAIELLKVRDMSNITYYEKFKNLIEVAEEHGANLCLHSQLIIIKANDVDSPTDKERKISTD